VDTGELLNILYEGVAVLIATRKAGEDEYGCAGISSESGQSVR
jgi:hypothetical protein